MKDILVIRKYKNRRLYDTEQSKHLTRDQLLGRIRSGRMVQVQEVSTGEDVTVETLLQLIQGEEGLAVTILTPEFLHFLIRTDASLLARFFRDVFPLSMQAFQAFMASMHSVQTESQKLVSGFSPLGMDLSSPWTSFAMASPSPQAKETGEPTAENEVAELRRQVDRMQAKLETLLKSRKD
jgi:polyhydroxyalkanoate synthesis repressor PhaR